MSYVDEMEDIRSEVRRTADAARLTKRLDAFRAVYEKTDRILSGMKVRVRMSLDADREAGSPDVPAWTDGETVSLNAKLINDELGHASLPVLVLHTKSLNLHELCHVIYTPRQGSDVVKWIKAEMGQGPGGVKAPSPHAHLLWRAFNALEDQRIETMFVSKYRPAIPFFEANVLKWILRHTQFRAESFFLIYGRKFLPAKVIAESEREFLAKYPAHLLWEFKDVIDSYLTVVYDQQTMKARSLISRMAAAMLELQSLYPYSSARFLDVRICHDNCGDTSIDKGKPSTKEQAEGARRIGTVKPRPSAGQDDDDDDGDEAEGDSDTGDQASDDQGEQGDDTSGAGNADGSKGESSDESEGGDPANGAGLGGDGSITMPPDRDPFEEALDELFNDSQFQDDLAETAEAIRQVIDGDHQVADGENLSTTSRSVPDDVKQAGRRAAENLRRLRTELEETHHRRQTMGAIDTRRFFQRKPWEADFFRTYEPGAYEDASLEAVILCDLSGSMSGVMTELSAALWIAKRSLEELDARVTVLGYSDDTYVMYQPYDRVSRTQYKVFGAMGGTDPTGALIEAYKLLKASTKTTKLLISLTDGDWQGDSVKQKALVKAMNDDDVVTAFLFLSSAGSRMPRTTFGHTIVKHITEPIGVAHVAHQIAEEGMRRLRMMMGIDA